ncbi:MAG: metallophosphoesterase, partial [Thaumarchaeota archaeon]|nr:metallophosphoesterase [Nitrososphaerota archaeon]
MSRFAHMADIHLGAHRDPVLQQLELKVFLEAMDKCVNLGVDFIIVSGDFFHVGIPDLGVVNHATKKMREVLQAGIPIYVIYGSHDYTPNGTSVIDILDTAGIVAKIVNWTMDEGKLKLSFTTDPKTGAKLTGISARRIGLESKYYEALDKESLEQEGGFKVFAFHSGITEFTPNHLKMIETVPISNFPKGFDYYAGGHIHRRGEFSLPGYGLVVFPGPLFTGYGKDIEDTARGEKRGFYVVDFDHKVRSSEFVEIKTFDGAYYEYDASGKNSVDVDKEIHRDLDGLDVNGKVVVVKIRGELAGGKTSDISFSKIRATLLEHGTLYIHLNRHGLSSKEYSKVKAFGEDISVIEGRIFKESIDALVASKILPRGGEGVSKASELLRVLRQGAKINESKKSYLERVTNSGIEILGLK